MFDTQQNLKLDTKNPTEQELEWLIEAEEKKAKYFIHVYKIINLVHKTDIHAVFVKDDEDINEVLSIWNENWYRTIRVYDVEQCINDKEISKLLINQKIKNKINYICDHSETLDLVDDFIVASSKPRYINYEDYESPEDVFWDGV